MEENKTVNAEKVQPLSYDELRQKLSELHADYQKLMMEYRKAINTLNNQDFTSFLLTMLFKVMEHPNRYSDKFVKWAANNIEGALSSLVNNYQEEMEKQQKDVEANK